MSETRGKSQEAAKADLMYAMAMLNKYVYLSILLCHNKSRESKEIKT